MVAGFRLRTAMPKISTSARNPKLLLNEQQKNFKSYPNIDIFYLIIPYVTK